MHDHPDALCLVEIQWLGYRNCGLPISEGWRRKREDRIGPIGPNQVRRTSKTVALRPHTQGDLPRQLRHRHAGEDSLVGGRRQLSASRSVSDTECTPDDTPQGYGGADEPWKE